MIVVLLASASCDAGDSSFDLVVDLQTDRVPGVEFTRVRTVTSQAVAVELDVSAGDTTFVIGSRVAELMALPPGIRTVDVVLLDASGVEVASGSRRFDLQTDQAITVLIASEACEGISCPTADGDPAADVCFMGRCVVPDCLRDDTPACPAPECALATECPASCLRARCEGGACICFMDGNPTCDEVTCGANSTCMDGLTQPCVCDDGYTGDGFTCADVDECSDGSAGCAVDALCSNTAGSFECQCPDGTLGDGTTCTNPCTDGTAGCHAAASCTLAVDGAECECLAGYTGDGTTCDRGAVLVVVECEFGLPDADCTYADEAATELGFTAQVVRGDAASTTAIGLGPWEAVVVDAWDGRIRSEFEFAMTRYVAAGGNLAFSYYNLDQVAFRSPLRVSATQYSGYRSIHPTPAGGVDLFAQADQVPALIEGTTYGGTSGHEIATLDADGLVVARSNDPSGPGAIAVTNGGRTIVNAFIPYETGARDLDGDSRPDAQELYGNELTYLTMPRVLVYADEGSARDAAEASVLGAGYALLRADAASLEAVIAAGRPDAIVALLGASTPGAVLAALTGWVSGGGRMIVGGPPVATDASLASALEVPATATAGARDLVRAAGFQSSFFDFAERFAGPLPGGVAEVELTPTADGRLDARFDDAAGPGAVVIARGGDVVVNGFAVGAGSHDSDSDGVTDELELLRNQIHFIVR